MKNKLPFLFIATFALLFNFKAKASAILVSVTSQTNVTCNGTCNGTANTSVSGNIGSVVYSWSPSGQTGANLINACAGTYTVTATDLADSTQSQAVVTITQPAALSVGMSHTDVTCNGGSNGSATANGIGGTPAYTYYWNPGSFTTSAVSGLSAGSYSVNITDANGCTANTNVIINQYPALTINAGPDQTICLGGNALLNPSFTGGNGTWTFNWAPPSGLSSSTLSNPVATPSTSMTYTVTITDGVGCSVSDAISITVNAPPAATASSNSPVCEGDNLQLTGTGGVAYSWTGPNGFSSTLSSPAVNAVTPLTAGNYSLTVTSASGCTATANTTVATNPTPVANAGADQNVCGLNTVFVDLSTGNPVNWYWTFGEGSNATNANPTMTYFAPGTYNVTLTVTTSFGCSSTDSALVTVNDLPVVSAGPDQTVCQNSTINLNGTGGITYSWSGPNGFMSSIVNPVLNATINSGGTYSLTATDMNGCSDSDFVEIMVIPYPQLNGEVNFLGAPVNGGNVNAYNVTAGVFSLAATSTITGFGSFSFSLAPGDYIVSAELDTANYNGAITTYDTSSVTWNTAVPYTLTCGSNSNTFINVIRLPQMTGSGTISGQIFGGNGPLKTWQQGDPVPGVDVSLEQNPGSVMLAQTTTDAGGAYSFNNVPNGTFSIYVDVPGLDMSASYNVTITPGNNTFNNAMFYVDSTGTIDTVSAIILGNRPKTQLTNSVSVFPNPYSGYTNISYEVSERSNVNVEVYNVLGEKVATLINTNKEAGKYNEKFSAKNYGAGAGIYFVRINMNGNVKTIRLVETN